MPVQSLLLRSHSPTIFMLLSLLLLTISQISANPDPVGPNTPSGPSDNSGPGTWNCKFTSPTTCGPSGPHSANGPTTFNRAYSVCLIRDSSVSEFLQCAGRTQQSTVTSGADDESGGTKFDTFDIFLDAVNNCEQCKIPRSTFAGFPARKDLSVNLPNYVCSTLRDKDLCCLSQCFGTQQQREHSLGNCQTTGINLQNNFGLVCDASSGGTTSSTSDDDREPSAAAPRTTPAISTRQSSTGQAKSASSHSAASSQSASSSGGGGGSSSSSSTATSTSNTGSSIRQATLQSSTAQANSAAPVAASSASASASSSTATSSPNAGSQVRAARGSLRADIVVIISTVYMGLILAGAGFIPNVPLES